MARETEREFALAVEENFQKGAENRITNRCGGIYVSAKHAPWETDEWTLDWCS